MAYPSAEVISEGNVGLMQAAQRFEPEQGFRFSTYAIWWIRAAIQSYICAKSLVKMGTTANQKKLFSKLHSAKSPQKFLRNDGDNAPRPGRAHRPELGVAEQEVIEMKPAPNGNVSLNCPILRWATQHLADQLAEEAPSQERPCSRRRAPPLAAKHWPSASLTHPRERGILEARAARRPPAQTRGARERFPIYGTRAPARGARLRKFANAVTRRVSVEPAGLALAS